MINLYKIIDDTFVNIWNQVHTRANATWIAQLQQQLSEAVPAYLLCTEAQAVEIRVTQHWLQAMVWQLRVRDIPMSNVAHDSPMNFQFPIKISKDLLTMTHQFSQPAMEVHGAGLVSSFHTSCIPPSARLDPIPFRSWNPCHLLRGHGPTASSVNL